MKHRNCRVASVCRIQIMLFAICIVLTGSISPKSWFFPSAAAASATVTADLEINSPNRARLLPAILAGAAVDGVDIELGICPMRIRPEDAPIILDRQARGVYDRPPGLILPHEAGAAAGATLFSVPLTIHVVRRSNGTGGITGSQIFQTIADANNIWAPTGIQFCQYGPTRFIDSDYWFDTKINTTLDATLRQIDVVPNTINVYFVPNYTLCGRSSFTFSEVQGIVMLNSCSSGVNPDRIGVFAHELGHYFDLFHTHEPFFGVECTSGANCDVAGDLVCDTPADPNLWGKVSTACVYFNNNDNPPTGSPCSSNDPPYDPDTVNVMSYTSFPCMTELTPGQIDRAIATLVNLRPELIEFDWCAMAGACTAGSGDCFVSNGSPGCASGSGTCCAKICVQDAFCCNVTWDSLCANQAMQICVTGETCEMAGLVGDGLTPPVNLLFASPSGTDTCSVALQDRWFNYTASCTGTATASVCHSDDIFFFWDVGLSAFSSCAGEQLACAANNNCLQGATISWPVVKGQTYPVRLTAEGSGVIVNFQCTGCGAPGSGSCFSTGPAYCNNHDCCQYVCANDPFCCNTSWDGLCVNQANQVCVQQCGGPITGSCYEAKSTPHCNRTACCNAICASDAFCCNVSWDSICANSAKQNQACEVFFLDGVKFFPLGNANLALDAGGNLEISNLDAIGASGVRADFAGAGLNLVGSSTFKLGLPSGLTRLEVVAMNDVLGTNTVVNSLGITAHVITWESDLLDFDLEVSVLLSPTYSVTVNHQNNAQLPSETFTGLTDPFAGTIFGNLGTGTPPRIMPYIEQDNVYTAVQFDEPLTMLVAGQFVTGDQIIIGTEMDSVADGLVPLKLGPLFDVDLLVSAPQGEVATVEEVIIGPPPGCAGNCGLQAALGCFCDAGCFARGDCCSDVCDHCGDFIACDDCPGDLIGPDGAPDGTVDVFDLIALINEWGPCADPSDCPADLSGPAGEPDGTVDVFDLIELINNWGPCL